MATIIAARGIPRAILELDLEPIMVKLLNGEDGPGWTIERTRTVLREYRVFLALMEHDHGHPIVPTKDIDEFWHTHILDTRKYAADCQVLFGRFMHHFPYLGMRGEQDELNLQDAFNKTKVLFRQFGVDLDANAADCGSEGNPPCGRCNANGCKTGGEFDETRPRLPEEIYCLING